MPGNLQLRASKSNFLKKLSKRWVFSICAKLLKRLFVTSDFFLAQKNRMMQHTDRVHITGTVPGLGVREQKDQS